ncbi:YbaY family lipoprotein [Kushneria aurantia]|uniref:YbaY family lipoprotein n=1 Tax=Kushneria aurantia TaxID=504092 RepID=A0ABV6G7V8_9GAMM|nr:YbaY family lipoprotein [Kushneria aurantia]
MAAVIRTTAALLLAATLSGCSLFSGGPQFATLSGEAVVASDAAISPQSQLEVRLLDMTGGRRTIAQVTQRTHGRLPVPFTLRYERSSLEEGRRYALSAALEDNGETRFLTLEPLPVLSGEAPQGELRVPLAPVSP